MKLRIGASIACIASLFLNVAAYGGGVQFCSIIPNHNPLTPGGINTDYLIEVFEAAGGVTPVTSYTPGTEYRVRISKNSGASDIKGILMGAFDGPSTSNRIGTWSTNGLSAGLDLQSSCNGVTHDGAGQKTFAQANWVAPSGGSAPENARVWSVIVPIKSQYFVAQTTLTKAGAVSASPTPSRSPSRSPAAASNSATPSRSPSGSPSRSPSRSPSSTPSATLSPGASPLSTPASTPTPSTTASMSVTPSRSASPSVSPSRSPSPSTSPARLCFLQCAAGQGSCAFASDGQQFCDCVVGYAGARCGSCDTGFFLSPTDTCVLKATGVASFELKFLGSLETVVGPEGSTERTAWVTGAQNEIKALLGMPATSTRVSIGAFVALSSGRQRLLQAAGFSATLVLSGADDNSASSTSTDDFWSVPNLANYLQEFTSNSSSALYRGQYMSQLHPTANLAVPVEFEDGNPLQPTLPSCGPSGYAFSSEIEQGVRFSWSVLTSSGSCARSQGDIDADSYIDIELVVGVPNTYVALGFAPEYNMIGTDAVVGYPDSALVQDVYIDAKTGSGVKVDTVQNVGSTPVAGTGSAHGYGNSTTVLKYSRPLAKSGPGDEDVSLIGSVRSGDPVTMVWAHGVPGISALVNHGPDGRGGANVNLLTGEVTGVTRGTIYLMHGILMTLAWGLLVPLGVFFAVGLNGAPRTRQCCSNADINFGGTKRAAVLPKGLWYIYHWRTQMSAAVLSLVAFILSVYASKAAFGSTHAILGLVVYLLSLGQVVWGLLRPDKPSAAAIGARATPFGGAVDVSSAPSSATSQSCSLRQPWEMCHRYTAIILLLLAWAAIVLGFKAYGLEQLPSILIPIASVLLAIVIAVVVQYRLITFYRSESQAKGGAIGSGGAKSHVSAFKRSTAGPGEEVGVEVPGRARSGSRVVMHNPLTIN